MSKIAHFMKGRIITSFPMTNRMWVTEDILWNAVSSDLLLWPTASEWDDCTFYETVSSELFLYQQLVSEIAHLWKAVSSHLSYSMWVTVHILWNTVSSHLFLWPTASEWDCTFCERQSHDSHHIFSYNQQPVSEIAHFVKHYLIPSHPITNSK